MHLTNIFRLGLPVFWGFWCFSIFLLWHGMWDFRKIDVLFAGLTQCRRKMGHQLETIHGSGSNFWTSTSDFFLGIKMSFLECSCRVYSRSCRALTWALVYFLPRQRIPRQLWFQVPQTISEFSPSLWSFGLLLSQLHTYGSVFSMLVSDRKFGSIHGICAFLWYSACCIMYRLWYLLNAVITTTLYVWSSCFLYHHHYHVRSIFQA